MDIKTKILIVDDEVSFAEGLSDILMNEGYLTEIANSGIEAIEKVKDDGFDIVLMDIKMPVMNGIETFKQIKKMNSNATVILMTAFSEEDIINEGLKEGAYGVLKKLTDMEVMLKTIEKAKDKCCLIMVTDDNPNTCETFKDVLAGEGYSVHTAHNGDEAIKIAKERQLGIVFIDMKLPVLNGFEVFQELKKIRKNITAVMMTGYREEMKDLVEKSLHEGAYTTIYKPFNPKDLISLVGEIVRSKKS
jgi:DNA-binding NtrC family response regulator